MLTIRLQRRGRKNDPSFRVIVTESKFKPKTGKYLELLGNYDPRTDRVVLNAERIKYWMSQGVGVSGTVNNLLVDAKIITGKKINVLGKKTPPKPAPVEEPKAAPVVAAAPAAAPVADEAVAEVAAAAEAPEAPAAGESPVAPEAPQA